MMPADRPLVLIHGVGLDHTMWHGVMAALPQRRTIAYDMIAHGSAGAPPGPYALSMFVDQLAGIVHAIGGPVDLVGFSMGALVAQAFAADDRAHQLRSLVLLNAVFDRSPTERQAIVDRVAEVRRNGALATIEPALQRWFTPGFAAAHPAVVDRIRQRLRNNDARAYADAYEVFATADRQLVAMTGAISVRTLVATGSDDQRSTANMAHRLAAALPKGECSILAGLRHLTPVEAPGLVASMIDEFC